MIYGFILVKQNPIICTCSNSGFGLGPAEKHGPILDMTILTLNKQIYKEAAEFILKNTFRLNDMNVSILKIAEAQRATLRKARDLIILYHPGRHRYEDQWVFDYEFAQFCHLENLYLVLYVGVGPSEDCWKRVWTRRSLEAWKQLWVGRKVTIEWRNTDREIQESIKYPEERKKMEDYLAQLEKDMVKGPRPEAR
jgi:hypothetical protein